MQVEETFLKGCFIIKPRIFEDERGVFFESFNQRSFNELIGREVNFVQDNQSISKKGVVRGLHFQKGTNAQAKLVRVVKGEVLDVVVDIRKDSETFGKHFSIVLTDQNNHQLFVPRGFAHGFITLSEETLFNYKCDNYYDKESESGILYNDPELNIDWKLSKSSIILSERDQELPYFKDLI